MKIPTSLLRQTVSVERYEGASAYGPVYSTAEDLPCRFEGTRRTVRRPGGTDVISSGTAFLRPDADVPVESRATIDGRPYTVLDVLPGQDLTGVSFLEVLLG